MCASQVGLQRGCLGDASYQAKPIDGGTWTAEQGGQYRLVNQNLQQSFVICLASENCNYIWIADFDEADGWGSRAVPECSMYDASNWLNKLFSRIGVYLVVLNSSMDSTTVAACIYKSYL